MPAEGANGLVIVVVTPTSMIKSLFNRVVQVLLDVTLYANKQLASNWFP